MTKKRDDKECLLHFGRSSEKRVFIWGDGVPHCLSEHAPAHLDTHLWSQKLNDHRLKLKHLLDRSLHAAESPGLAHPQAYSYATHFDEGLKEFNRFFEDLSLAICSNVRVRFAYLLEHPDSITQKQKDLYQENLVYQNMAFFLVEDKALRALNASVHDVIYDLKKRLETFMEDFYSMPASAFNRARTGLKYSPEDFEHMLSIYIKMARLRCKESLDARYDTLLSLENEVMEGALPLTDFAVSSGTYRSPLGPRGVIDISQSRG